LADVVVKWIGSTVSSADVSVNRMNGRRKIKLIRALADSIHEYLLWWLQERLALDAPTGVWLLERRGICPAPSRSQFDLHVK
jgi:hypothetical protein